jgi:hypothetical protein
MTHSFFSDVIRIGCTSEDPKEYAQALSKNSPGDYSLVYSLACSEPCEVKKKNSYVFKCKKIRTYLNAKKYVNEFYQVPAELAVKLLKRETLKIPIVIC